MTPTLSVFADSLSDPTSDPDLVQSSASGIQAYTSTENRTITLDILLTTGEVSGPLLSTNAVVANVVVFKPGAPELTFDGDTLEEIALDPILASAHRSAGLFATPFSSIPSASLEFDVVAGESFLIWALLLAQSEDGGVADASSTLSMQLFDTGSELDENDLIIASKNVGVVPLPAGVWLFLSGIGLIVGLGSRRKAAVTG